MSNFEEWKGPSGGIVDIAITLLYEAVDECDVTKQEGEDFAGQLDKKVKGRFKHAQNETNFKFDKRAMQDILANFHKVKAYQLTPKASVDAIVKALKEAPLFDLGPLAKKIEDACREESDEHFLASQAASQVVCGIQKVITELPKTLHMIPNLRKRPTSTAPVPSDQGKFPVCASHAVGKGVVGLLDACGFDLVGGQKKVIDDLVDQVQPNKQAEDPDRFNDEILRVNIKKDGKKYDVKVKINIQTDYAFSPKPCMDAEVQDKKKIKMIIRAKMPTEHAIFAKSYNVQKDEYNCINSWGENEPYPGIKKEVYALDYIQISEI